MADSFVSKLGRAENESMFGLFKRKDSFLDENDSGADRAHRQRPRRDSVSCSATILTDERFFPCQLRDVSSGGCRIALSNPFPVGQPIRIALEEFHSLGGTVRWCRDGEAGIQFTNPIGDYTLRKWQMALERSTARKDGNPGRDFWGRLISPR
jgi:hypothetical protein